MPHSDPSIGANCGQCCWLTPGRLRCLRMMGTRRPRLRRVAGAGLWRTTTRVDWRRDPHLTSTCTLVWAGVSVLGGWPGHLCIPRRSAPSALPGGPSEMPDRERRPCGTRLLGDSDVDGPSCMPGPERRWQGREPTPTSRAEFSPFPAVGLAQPARRLPVRGSARGRSLPAARWIRGSRADRHWSGTDRTNGSPWPKRTPAPSTATCSSSVSVPSAISLQPTGSAK